MSNEYRRRNFRRNTQPVEEFHGWAFVIGVCALTLLASGCRSISFPRLSATAARMSEFNPLVRLVSHNQPVTPTVVQDPISPATPSLVATSTLGNHPKTAVDIVVELEDALKQVRRDNRYLLKQLQLAEDTIEDQKESMAQAAVELNKSRHDFGRVQTEMLAWRDKFNTLTQKTLEERRTYEQAFRRLEQRLQTMLIQYADSPTMRVSKVGEE